MGIAHATRSARPVRVYPADQGATRWATVGDGTVGAAGRAPRRSRGAVREPASTAAIRPLVFVAALLGGFVLLALVSILCGLLVTDVLVRSGGLGDDDEGVVRDLVAERTPFLTDASFVGSTIGGAPVLPILVGLVAIVCAFMRKWRIAAFAVFVLVVESATYRVTSIVVPRERPDVPRLEDLPADASYPSGHTAASIAVYAGLVLLLTSRFKSRGVAGRALDRRDPAADRGRAVAHVPRHAPPARRGRRRSWSGSAP